MKQYGLLIERVNRYGSEHIIVRPVARDEAKDSMPIGCSSDGESSWDEKCPRHLHGLQLDGLCLDGFVSDYGNCSFIGFEAEYREVFSIELPKLTRMTKTLKRVVAQQQRDKAYEPGDRFVSFAKALKSSFVAYRIKSSDGECKFGFLNVIDGRNYLRRVIEETEAEVREAKRVA